MLCSNDTRVSCNMSSCFSSPWFISNFIMKIIKHKNYKKCHWTPTGLPLRFHNQHFVSHHIYFHLSTHPSIHLIFIRFEGNNRHYHTLFLNSSSACLYERFFKMLLETNFFLNHNNWRFNDLMVLKCANPLHVHLPELKMKIYDGE